MISIKLTVFGFEVYIAFLESDNPFYELSTVERLEVQKCN